MEGTTQRRDDGVRLGLTRRDLLKRGAVGGALVWSVPIVTSLGLSPASAQTASGGCGVASAGLLFFHDPAPSITGSVATLSPTNPISSDPVFCLKVDNQGNVGWLGTGGNGQDVQIAKKIYPKYNSEPLPNIQFASSGNIVTGVYIFITLPYEPDGKTSYPWYDAWILNGTLNGYTDIVYSNTNGLEGAELTASAYDPGISGGAIVKFQLIC